MDILSLIIQLVLGAVGGNGAGAALKQYSLGTTGNTIAGAVGGLILGQILERTMGMPAADAAAAANSIGSIVQDVIGGAAGGGILTIIVGIIKQMMNKS
jgi:hypothetical protein